MVGKVYRLEISTPPPSVNAMWRAVKGRNILSEAGRLWKEQAATELMNQKGLRGPCYWRADILIPASKTKSDLDNLMKGTLDALHESGKAPDDRYLVDLRIRFHGGDTVKIAIQMESLETWANIKKASKALIRKLARL